MSTMRTIHREMLRAAGVPEHKLKSTIRRTGIITVRTPKNKTAASRRRESIIAQGGNP